MVYSLTWFIAGIHCIIIDTNAVTRVVPNRNLPINNQFDELNKPFT